MPGPTAEAVPAGAAPVAAARPAEAEDDPLALLDVALGARPEGLDDADGLMAETAGPRDAHPVAPGQVEVGVAHPGRADAHDRLVGAGDGLRQVLDGQAVVTHLDRLHGLSPWSGFGLARRI